jgi:hypothetical protein
VQPRQDNIFKKNIIYISKFKTCNMNNTTIIGIDIEDYYGNALVNISFDNEIEIDLDEFDVRLENFTISGDYEEDGGIIARLQYDVEGGMEDDELEEAHQEILDIILINADGKLGNEDEVSKEVRKALELLLI